MIAESYEDLTAVKARFKGGVETIEIKEAAFNIEVADYTYVNESFEIETKAASTKWVKRKADKNCLSADPEDCLVWCMVEVPAEKRTFTKKVKKGCPYGYEDAGTHCFRKVSLKNGYKDYATQELVTDGSYNEKTIDARYKNVKTDVLIEDAKVTERAVPAKTQVIKREVIKTPAKYTTTTIEAEYIDVEQRIVDVAAKAILQTVPEQYGSCEKTVTDKEAEVVTKDVKPEILTVTKTRVTNTEKFTEWREVLCPADVTSYTIRQIQRALSAKGYDPGPIDNVLGVKTKTALTKFQKDNGLPVGQLDFQTLSALGIQF